MFDFAIAARDKSVPQRAPFGGEVQPLPTGLPLWWKSNRGAMRSSSAATAVCLSISLISGLLAAASSTDLIKL